MSELLSAVNASESANKSEKNLDDTKSRRNEDWCDKALKSTKVNKTITEIRKSRDEGKILRDLDFTFDLIIKLRENGEFI